jgi:hypothetical protein
VSLSIGAFVSSFVDLPVRSVAHLLLDCLLVQLLDSSSVQNLIESWKRSSVSFMHLKDTPWHTRIVRLTYEVLVCDAESFVSDIVTLAPFVICDTISSMRLKS